MPEQPGGLFASWIVNEPRRKPGAGGAVDESGLGPGPGPGSPRLPTPLLQHPYQKHGGSPILGSDSARKASAVANLPHLQPDAEFNTVTTATSDSGSENLSKSGSASSTASNGTNNRNSQRQSGPGNPNNFKDNIINNNQSSQTFRDSQTILSSVNDYIIQSNSQNTKQAAYQMFRAARNMATATGAKEGEGFDLEASLITPPWTASSELPEGQQQQQRNFQNNSQYVNQHGPGPGHYNYSDAPPKLSREAQLLKNHLEGQDPTRLQANLSESNRTNQAFERLSCPKTTSRAGEIQQKVCVDVTGKQTYYVDLPPASELFSPAKTRKKDEQKAYAEKLSRPRVGHDDADCKPVGGIDRHGNFIHPRRSTKSLVKDTDRELIKQKEKKEREKEKEMNQQSLNKDNSRSPQSKSNSAYTLGNPLNKKPRSYSSNSLNPSSSSSAAPYLHADQHCEMHQHDLNELDRNIRQEQDNYDRLQARRKREQMSKQERQRALSQPRDRNRSIPYIFPHWTKKPIENAAVARKMEEDDKKGVKINYMELNKQYRENNSIGPGSGAGPGNDFDGQQQNQFLDQNNMTTNSLTSAVSCAHTITTINNMNLPLSPHEAAAARGVVPQNCRVRLGSAGQQPGGPQSKSNLSLGYMNINGNASSNSNTGSRPSLARAGQDVIMNNKGFGTISNPSSSKVSPIDGTVNMDMIADNGTVRKVNFITGNKTPTKSLANPQQQQPQIDSDLTGSIKDLLTKSGQTKGARKLQRDQMFIQKAQGSDPYSQDAAPVAGPGTYLDHITDDDHYDPQDDLRFGRMNADFMNNQDRKAVKDAANLRVPNSFNGLNSKGTAEQLTEEEEEQLLWQKAFRLIEGLERKTQKGRNNAQTVYQQVDGMIREKGDLDRALLGPVIVPEKGIVIDNENDPIIGQSENVNTSKVGHLNNSNKQNPPPNNNKQFPGPLGSNSIEPSSTVAIKLEELFWVMLLVCSKCGSNQNLRQRTQRLFLTTPGVKDLLLRTNSHPDSYLGYQSGSRLAKHCPEIYKLCVKGSQVQYSEDGSLNNNDGDKDPNSSDSESDQQSDKEQYSFGPHSLGLQRSSSKTNSKKSGTSKSSKNTTGPLPLEDEITRIRDILLEKPFVQSCLNQERDEEKKRLQMEKEEFQKKMKTAVDNSIMGGRPAKLPNGGINIKKKLSGVTSRVDSGLGWSNKNATVGGPIQDQDGGVHRHGQSGHLLSQENVSETGSSTFQPMYLKNINNNNGHDMNNLNMNMNTTINQAYTNQLQPIQEGENINNQGDNLIQQQNNQGPNQGPGPGQGPGTTQTTLPSYLNYSWMHSVGSEDDHDMISEGVQTVGTNQNQQGQSSSSSSSSSSSGTEQQIPSNPLQTSIGIQEHSSTNYQNQQQALPHAYHGADLLNDNVDQLTVTIDQDLNDQENDQLMNTGNGTNISNANTAPTVVAPGPTTATTGSASAIHDVTSSAAMSHPYNSGDTNNMTIQEQNNDLRHVATMNIQNQTYQQQQQQQGPGQYYGNGGNMSMSMNTNMQHQHMQGTINMNGSNQNQNQMNMNMNQYSSTNPNISTNQYRQGPSGPSSRSTRNKPNNQNQQLLAPNHFNHQAANQETMTWKQGPPGPQPGPNSKESSNFTSIPKLLNIYGVVQNKPQSSLAQKQSYRLQQQQLQQMQMQHNQVNHLALNERMMRSEVKKILNDDKALAQALEFGGGVEGLIDNILK